MRSLEEIGENLITWFSNNQMEINPDKCQEQTTLKIGNLHIKNSSCEKLFGINFDYKLNFAKHRVAKKHQES